MSDFFHMGGYAVFVWSSYGIAAVLLTISWVTPLMRSKAILKKLKRRQSLTK